MGSSAAKDELVLAGGVRLERIDFSDRRLRYVSIGDGSRLIECHFSGISTVGGVLGRGDEPTEYVGCVFDGSHLSNVIPGRATFIECSFRKVRLKTFICHEAEFVDCVFSGVLKGVVFNATPSSTDKLGRTRNTYRGNDFTEAELRDVSFRGGIDLDSQRLPTDPEYFILRNAAEALVQTRQQVERWPEAELRDEADTALWVLERVCETGQRDLFVRRSILGRSPETISRMTALLSPDPVTDR